MNNAAKMQPHQYLLYELTTKCQNNCVFCYNVWKEDESYPTDELTTEEAMVVLGKAIHESGCKNIGLTGGEPLLRKDIFEIASYISGKGVSPILLSKIAAKVAKENTIAAI